MDEIIIKLDYLAILFELFERNFGHGILRLAMLIFFGRPDFLYSIYILINNMMNSNKKCVTKT